MKEDLDRINEAWERSGILDAPATESVTISEAFESGKAMYQSGANDMLAKLLGETEYKDEPPCDGCSECWTCGGGYLMRLRDQAKAARAAEAAVRRQLSLVEQQRDERESPEMQKVHRAFYDLVVTERDVARKQRDRLREQVARLRGDLHAERERHQQTVGEVDELQERVRNLQRMMGLGCADVPRLEPWIYDRTRTPDQSVRLLFGGLNIEVVKGIVRAAAKVFHIDLEPHGVRAWVRLVVGNLKRIRDARGPHCGHASSMLASLPDDLRTEFLP